MSKDDSVQHESQEVAWMDRRMEGTTEGEKK